MNEILTFLLGYLFLLVLWFVINLLLHAVTILTKKSFITIPEILNSLISFAIQIYFLVYPLYLLWQTIKYGQWWLFILLIIFGGFVIQWWQFLYTLIFIPFVLITNYFSQKVKIILEKNDDDYEYEYLDPKGKIIGKSKSDGKVNKELSRWFLISYGLTFFYQFISSNKDSNVGLGIYVLMPFIVVLFFSVIISIFMIIWNFIKRRTAFNGEKKEFLAKAFKIYGLIYLFLFIIEILYLL